MSRSPSNVTIPEHHNVEPFTLTPLVCYAPTMLSMGGIWKGENPLDYAFPLFLFQLLLIVLTTRATAVVLQPFHQPRYLAEIIGGILLGPSVMGQIPNFGHLIFPLRSVLILETMANLGLIYFMFIVGIEIDPSTVRRSGKSLSFAVACIGIPFTLGHLAVFIAPPKLGMSASNWAFLIFLCVTLSITAFSVLARSLAELKLLNTSLGATALNTAVLVDSFAWILLSLAITLAQNGKTSGTFYTFLSGFAFYLTMTVVMKPAMQWVINRTPEGEEVDDVYACAILVSVLVAAFVSDAIGIHAVTGAFMFGMVVPNGSLGEALIERIEDFVEGLLLPLFFVTSGLKTDFGGLKSTAGAMFVVGMVVTGTVGKVGGCMVVARLYGMTMRDGIAMGLLMNTKGVVEMVLLNIGRERKLLSEEAFSTLVTLSIVITAVATPLLRYVARPARHLAFYKRRTVLWPKPDDDLRVVLCGYSPRHVPANLALLDSLNPSKRSPISVLSLHLVELTSRASATTILNSAASKDFGSLSSSFVDPSASFSSLASSASAAPKSSADHVIHTYETYEQHTAGVSVLPLIAVSPFTSMHRDIFGVAEENHAALIILPFHKQQTVDGGMESTNPAIHTMNQTVLNSAPCSVAVLVDRGLRTASRFPGSARNQVTLLFLGGPDDREAIAIASRMVEHPGISLTVVRLVATDSSPKAQRVVDMSDGQEEDWERQRDDDCIGEFRLRCAGYKTVAYRERAVSNAEETVAAIRGTLEEGGKDLYVVGRGGEAESALTAGMTEWSECPELGVIGDLMASTDFGAKVSVLVVQQCRGVKSGKVKAVEVEEGMEIMERYDMCTRAEK